MIVDDLGSSVSFIMALEGFGTRPIRTKISLELTSELILPCDVWKKCMEEKIPTLKKQAKGTYDPGDPGDPGGSVKIDRAYRTTDEEEREVELMERVKVTSQSMLQVAAEANASASCLPLPCTCPLSALFMTLFVCSTTSQGYRYGPEYVPVTEQDACSLNVPGDAVIRTLGFIHSSQIPRHYYLESVNIVEGGTDAAARTICALSKAMCRESHLLVARYVKKKGSDVVLVALQPSREQDGSLLMHR